MYVASHAKGHGLEHPAAAVQCLPAQHKATPTGKEPHLLKFFVMASGLRKQKKYNWKETNLSLFGSDLEKKVPQS